MDAGAATTATVPPSGIAVPPSSITAASAAPTATAPLPPANALDVGVSGTVVGVGSVGSFLRPFVLKRRCSVVRAARRALPLPIHHTRRHENAA